MDNTYKKKDPDSKINFIFDWVPYLNNDTIDTSIWISELILLGDSKTTTTTKVKVSGGILGETYILTNRITTITFGETIDRSIYVKIEQR